MPNEKGAPRDKNQPFPKDPPKGSLGSTLGKVLFLILLMAFLGSLTVYTLQVKKTPPWTWSGQDWKDYATWSEGKVREVDWSKVTGKTRELWNSSEDLIKKIESKLPGNKAAPAATGTGAPPPATSPERTQGLEALRAGIEHYRKSVPKDEADDREITAARAELKAAMAKFEEAQKHLEKALAAAKDEKEKAEIAQELSDCGRYLEDCRLREKG